MGLLQQNLTKFTRIYEQTNGFITDNMLVSWFGKSAVKRTELKDMTFTKRSAVVIVGVSGSGKTHLAREFIKVYPNFVLCSHDECYAKAMIDMRTRDEAQLDVRMTEYLERMIRSAVKHNNNVIFDGLFVSPVVRAALINTLRTMGFEIHVVYLTLEHLNRHLTDYSILKAIQTQAHRLHSLKHKNELSAQHIVTNRHNAVELFAEDNNLTVDQAIDMLASHPEVGKMALDNYQNAVNEVESHLVAQQESAKAFMLGTDYYYEL